MTEKVARGSLVTDILVKYDVNPKEVEIVFTDSKIKGHKHSGFKGNKFDTLILGKTIYAGIKGIKEPDDWRLLGFKIGNLLSKNKIKRVAVILPLKSQEFVQGLLFGTSPNDLHKSKPESRLKTLTIIPEDWDDREYFIEELNKSLDLVQAQLLTQELVDNTGEDANSYSILEEVFDHFEDTDVGVDFYDPEDLEELEMRGHLAVNRASHNPARTIKLTYSSKNKNAKNLVFVGKGLTYDTGGLSLKPTDSMINMKADKSGAMTLIGFMAYIARHGSSNNITCYIALAENCIGPDSYRPGDVLVMKNGKTVDIKNTDAEGRLVLFDNLCLAQEENKKIDSIYSIATLTGAAVYQFGEEAAGLVGFNDKMKKKVIKAGKEQGEIFIDAVFHKYMLDGVKGTNADLSNTGTPNMGCQKAGLFLTNAMKKKNIKKYLHIDIAGPAYTDKGFGSYKAGASGFGVRTLVNLVK